jgi:hypothetical protein
MGIIDSVKRLRSNDRHGVLGEPKPGVQTFAYRDCKSQHIMRYCERAEESGFMVELASDREARHYEQLLDDAGVGVGRAWHVLVWRPGEERPELQIDPRNVSQLPGSPD